MAKRFLTTTDFLAGFQLAGVDGLPGQAVFRTTNGLSWRYPVFNLEGGAAATVYGSSINDLIDGGSAATVYGPHEIIDGGGA